MRSSGRRGMAAALLVVAALSSAVFAQSDAKALYNEAVAREATLRKELAAHPVGAPPGTLVTRLRTLAGSYQDLARLFPSSGYSDNALWQGGMLAADAYDRFGEAVDRDLATRLLKGLISRFPTSSRVKPAKAVIARLDGSAPAQVAQPPAAPAPAPAVAAPLRAGQSVLRGIRRDVLPDALRFTLELEREVAFRDERIDGPPRIFIDLQNTRPTDDLKDVTIPFQDDVVKQVRVGRQADARTRVVLDLAEPGRHSVYALYNPYRVVIDVERRIRPMLASAPSASAAPPVTPSANTTGGFSLSRQLGLGVTRLVIDPGHGGHDPGAKASGLTEADLVLDVALRLETLLKKQGVDVVLTRRGNTYLSLEDRTAMANQSGADLFLSIHANANSLAGIGGVETYFLNFAQTKEAEAIAARENAGSAKSMHELPDIIRAIALSNKIDESRDFARMVQASLYDRLRKVNKEVRNLGVKQAPFVVLIGATMPSILSEIAFMTNRQEAALLKTEKYRQQIADALGAGILKYQDSLKKAAVVATQ